MAKIFVFHGEAGVTRTLGPLLRRQMLYPTELQPHVSKSLVILQHSAISFNLYF